jgi:dTDP-4-dehydrorhamnose reductase
MSSMGRSVNADDRTGPVMVVGGSGMLGHRIVRHLASSRAVIALLRAGPRSVRLVRVLRDARVVETGALDSRTIGALLDRHAPRALVNAAGLIKQRPASADPITMIETNALLPHRLAAECGSRGIRFLHVSSDCVFGGARGHYREDDPTDAQDLYGRTKALGEPTGERCLTLRTSIIGPEIDGAFGLLEWFRTRAGQTAPGYRRVIFPGLPTIRLAMLIESVIDRFTSLSGLYHVGAEPIAKHDLLQLINQRYQLNVTIEPADTPVSDRSLDCSRFRTATGFLAEPWPILVDMMAADEEAERRAALAQPSAEARETGRT